MPATCTLCSSSSLSSFSISPHRQILSGPTNLTFSEFLALFENDDDYKWLMVTLFEWHNFILKTNAMRHVAKLIRCFQDKIDEQQDYIRSIFTEMEWAGIHELLNQDYKQTGGTIRRQWRVHFTPTTTSRSLSPILQPPTPYPRSTLSSSSSPCLVALQYSPTASQYSPTASQYGTPPKSPTFSPEILFPNLNFVPIQETQEEFHRRLEEQYLELSTDEIANVEWIEWQIEEEMKALRRIWVDWVNYQGGIGSRFNPIIIEDDWNQGFQV